MSRTSTPPMAILPSSTSQCRTRRRASVDFPDPDGPTSAVNDPLGMLRDTPCRTSSPSP